MLEKNCSGSSFCNGTDDGNYSSSFDLNKEASAFWMHRVSSLRFENEIAMPFLPYLCQKIAMAAAVTPSIRPHRTQFL